MRSAASSAVVSTGIRHEEPKSWATPHGKSEEAIRAKKAESINRRSEGPLLEPCFSRRRDRVTAQLAQRTPKEKVRVLQRKLYRAAKAQPERTFGVLYDKVCQEEVLWVAWEQVRRNRGTAGVDGETIEAIEANGVTQFLEELRLELRGQRYRPHPVR